GRSPGGHRGSRSWGNRRCRRGSAENPRHVSKPRPVHIVGSAARAIAEAAQWWTANREKAPDGFADEIERALQLSAMHPGIGARATNARLAGVRRIHLARIHYHLYYRVMGTPETVEVLALWHTSRGSPPPIVR